MNTHEPIILASALNGRRDFEWHSHGERRIHVFTDDEVKAVDAALLARRPLLLLGEPGTGKSQLAEAVAAVFGAPFVPWTVDARTEPGDLLYRVDYVERLAHAQVASFAKERGGLHEPGLRPEALPTDTDVLVRIQDLLDLAKFVIPGPLWWALDFEGARRHRLAEPPERATDWKAGDRVVTLIDEIDKADPDVPNGLLEVLGHERFRGPRGTIKREAAAQAPPLVFVTSNDERDLPDAFLRRCLVLVLGLGKDDGAAHAFLTTRGKKHFGQLDDKVIGKAAEDLLEDRGNVKDGPRPGLAEYLDLLRVLDGSRPFDPSVKENAEQRRARHLDLLTEVRRFTFQKFAEIGRERRERER